MSGLGGTSKCVRVRIEGRVQGVWFRAWTVQEATRRGLSGWVRNRRDGSVEAVLSGPADKVDDMIAACHSGPPAAGVSAVTQTAEAEQPAAGQFEQRATA